MNEGREGSKEERMDGMRRKGGKGKQTGPPPPTSLFLVTDDKYTKGGARVWGATQ